MDDAAYWCGLTFRPAANGLLLPEGQCGTTLRADDVLRPVGEIDPHYAPTVPLSDFAAPCENLFGFPITPVDELPPTWALPVTYEELLRLAEPGVN